MATPDKLEDAPNQIKDLEKAFKDCLGNLTSQDYFSPNESEETRQTVEHTIQHFLDTARQTEAFFLTQRLHLSVQKPEQVLKEEIIELRQELERKEKLIEKHHERLQSWQGLLQRSNIPIPPSSAATPSQPSLPPPAQSQGYPGPPQQMGPGPGMMPQGAGVQAGQYPGPPLPGAQGYGMPPPHQLPPSYTQNPLTYLEQNLSNIGMPERR
ncbi:mediator of RNA polymerase II transcription subunit 28-like [Babylonia areolata]|uniref:mediator of RNA polymerase II transcription subunit 28-like n=1 Tax=Babylonia areolata TaxID=304850 RepID=UPI003FD03C5A